VAAQGDDIQLIIDAAWARLRFSKIEAGVLRFLLSDDIEPGVLAEASNRILETLSRYATTKKRTLTRAMRDLERLQDRRRRNASHPVGQRLIGAQDAPRFGAMLLDLHAASQSGRVTVSTPVRAAAVMDAELAAIATAHGVARHTTDRDFGRFAGLCVVNPLQ
jgi:predicted nucleic acid-binding protein